MDGPAWCREMLPEPTGSSHAPPRGRGDSTRVLGVTVPVS